MIDTEVSSIKLRFGIIGNSPSLNHAIEVAVQVAPTDMTVLITGESGVGKESFSKIIHQLSHHKHGQFIAINCGAIPASLHVVITPRLNSETPCHQSIAPIPRRQKPTWHSGCIKPGQADWLLGACRPRARRAA